MFKKILIANRGEIAVRIIRACHEMGIRTVAVYSEADATSLHVQLADEAVCIGPAESSKSYLNIPSLISAAEVTDAEAIHPGYGFLAENAHFAEVCRDCQIKFIGPSVEAIKTFGNKDEAKKAMIKVEVPTVPGSPGVIDQDSEAVKAARQVGYPVIVKAAAGGGGRGMRIAHTEASLLNALHTCQAEAEKAFGNSQVYIEKYLEDPRHIEFQIMADEHGNVFHLGERDCTIQRRHQKLLEESPSPIMTEALREKMGEAVIRGAKAVKYSSLGTMEFLIDKHGDFYFMEVNTRVQVEHPVTELVTGMDLVKEQIHIAAGKKVDWKQRFNFRGHAMECRINAEDPDNNFLPTPGKITKLRVPGGPGVRVDTHIYEGYNIPPYYDSLVAKLLVHGRDRQEAIARMERALGEFTLEGIKTTIPFHLRLLATPEFRRGEIHTHFVEEHFLKVK